MLEELGADTHAFFRVDARRPQVGLDADHEDASLLADETTLFTARIDPRTSARQGSGHELAVDPAQFHFFDVDDGGALVAEPVELPVGERLPVAAEEWS